MHDTFMRLASSSDAAQRSPHRLHPEAPGGSRKRGQLPYFEDERSVLEVDEIVPVAQGRTQDTGAVRVGSPTFALATSR